MRTWCPEVFLATLMKDDHPKMQALDRELHSVRRTWSGSGGYDLLPEVKEASPIN